MFSLPSPVTSSACPGSAGILCSSSPKGAEPPPPPMGESSLFQVNGKTMSFIILTYFGSSRM